MKTRKHLLLITAMLLLIVMIWGASAASLKLSPSLIETPKSRMPDVQINPPGRNLLIPGEIELDDSDLLVPVRPRQQDIVTPQLQINTPVTAGPTREPVDDSLRLRREHFMDLYWPENEIRANPPRDWTGHLDWDAIAKLVDDEEIDLSTVSWVRFGRIYSPDGNATTYKKPYTYATVMRSLPHEYPVSAFGYLSSHPGWAVILMGGSGVPEYLPANQVKEPVNEFQEELDGIDEWHINGYVRTDIGPAPVYDGPGTNYNIIGYKQPGETIWSSTYWPPDTNWVVLYDKDFVGSGYGDGLGFMPAQYYERK